jgi:hypothetical protein
MDVERAGFTSLIVVAVACLLGACAGTTRISAIHDPLYRAEAHSSTITATASNQEKKIAEIRIDVIDGEMTACTENGGLPSVIPCRRNATFQARICQFPGNPASATCTWTRRLGDRRLITYDATARTASGTTSTTRTITYAAGASITQATFDVPFIGSFTVNWDVARPVWWHTTFPSGNAAQDRIGVGFFPDPDFANYRAFTDVLQPLVLAAYFDTNAGFSQFYSFWRGLFDLWAGPPGADAQLGPAGGPICTRTFGGFASNIAGVTDGEAILHTANFRDCASISLGGSGTVWTGIASPAFRFMHESGHFLHGLGDEYCCNGGYFSASIPRNIDSSQANCQSTATSIGVATSLCVQIGTTGSWRIDDGSAEIMVDGGNTAADWRDAAARVLGNRVTNCNNGNCY